MPFALLATAAAVNTWPFVVLLISVAFVIASISLFKLHPFVSLIMAGILAGVLAEKLPIDEKAPDKGHLVRAVEITVEGLGKTTGDIGVIIAMATLIALGLMESGAADKVVRRLLAVFGQHPIGISLAIALSTYFLSVPIFFDSMYMLMLPIAMAMALRTGKNFTLYTMSIVSGAVVTHSLMVPHPGPSFMAEYLKIDVGLTIWVGIVVGFVPMIIGWIAVQKMNKLTPIPLRGSATAPLEQIRSLMDKPESELPSFVGSLLPVIVPILLISFASVFEVIKQTHLKEPTTWSEAVVGWFGGDQHFMMVKKYVEFIGNKNVALIIGAFMALRLLKKQRKLTWHAISDLCGPPLEVAAIMILISAAGGGFGAALRGAGVGDSLKEWALQHKEINLIWLGWLCALIFRVSQGSATVSMQTVSLMMVGLVPALPCHPIYLFLAIGFGAIGCSWMNDAGFWVVCRLSNFTVRETLRTWTVLLSILSFAGVVFTWLLSILLPFKS